MESGTTEYEQDIRAQDVSDEDRDAGEKAAADAFALAFGDASGDRALGKPGADLKENNPADAAAAPAPAEGTSASPSPAPAPTASAPAPVADDPYKDLPPAVREVVARHQSLENDMRAMHGRVAPLQRENEELKRRLQALEGGRSPAPSPAPAADPMPKRERVRTELPEVAEALDEMDTRLRAMSPPAAPAAAPAPAADEDDAALRGEVQILAGIHPDWDKVLNSRDYLVWQASQPEARRAELARTNRSAPVAVAISEFKTHQQRATDAAAEAQRREQLRANRTGAAVATRGRAVPQGNVDAIDPQAAFVAGFNSA